jgi:carbonic anhydrase
MEGLRRLLANNRDWADKTASQDPEFFAELAAQQSPHYLWIGCSDSRVPANQIVGLQPGAVFVHRNVANIVGHADLNCLSVLQYAIEVLAVRHVIVVGHYGCGGVAAAMDEQSRGLIDDWLKPIEEIASSAAEELSALPEGEPRENRLCELNVQQQVINVANTSIVEAAWAREQALGVHGWIYSLKDGLLRDLGCSHFGPSLDCEA